MPSRWNKAYSKIKEFDNEINNELLFYNQTNDLLLNIKENKRPFDIIFFLDEFMKNFKNCKLNGIIFLLIQKSFYYKACAIVSMLNTIINF